MKMRHLLNILSHPVWIKLKDDASFKEALMEKRKDLENQGLPAGMIYDALLDQFGDDLLIYKMAMRYKNEAPIKAAIASAIVATQRVLGLSGKTATVA